MSTFNGLFQISKPYTEDSGYYYCYYIDQTSVEDSAFIYVDGENVR